MFKKPNIAFEIYNNKEKESEIFFSSDWRKKEILKVETLECMKYAAACFSAAVNSSFIF